MLRAPVLVRVHSLSVFADLFHESGDRAGQLTRAMQAIADEGAGVPLSLNKERV